MLNDRTRFFVAAALAALVVVAVTVLAIWGDGIPAAEALLPRLEGALVPILAALGFEAVGNTAKRPAPSAPPE